MKFVIFLQNLNLQSIKQKYKNKTKKHLISRNKKFKKLKNKETKERKKKP
jgi:hypothetical protein